VPLASAVWGAGEPPAPGAGPAGAGMGLFWDAHTPHALSTPLSPVLWRARAAAAWLGAYSWARLSRGSSTLAPLSWTWTWSCGLRKQGGPLQDDHEVPQRVGREREPQLTARLLVQACRVRVRVGAGFGLGLALGLGLGLGLGCGLGIGSFTSRHTSLPPSRPPRAAKKSGPPSPPKACLAGGEVRVVT